MRVSVLLVEPDDELAARLCERLGALADVHRHSRFDTARAELLEMPFSVLVTNLRLGSHNGLHLTYIAASVPAPPRSIVYTDRYDPSMGREIQRAGAFYEDRTSLVHSLPSYILATLPARDRRDPAGRDRRLVFRGGRRSSDQPAVHSSAVKPIRA